MAPNVKSNSEDRKFDVALSFAGENREFVEEVASGLSHRGIRVFYDRYEEADLWGKDLYDHLAKVYSKDAEYCVIFASEEYEKKVWATHERRNAQERALSENREYILPARFDDTSIPGIRDTVGYIDLRTHSVDDLVELISKKLGPRERRNYLPPEMDRLFEHLELEDAGQIEWATRHAVSFFYEFADLKPEERRVVFNILTRGCPGNMPVDVHVSLERLSRWLGVEPTEVVRTLKRLRPFGFEFSTYGDAAETEDESDDQMVALSWQDMNVYDEEFDEEFVMQVVVAIVETMSEDHCPQCVNGVIDRCDFSPLAPPVERHIP